jgi:ferrous iron transport protein A
MANKKPEKTGDYKRQDYFTDEITKHSFTYYLKMKKLSELEPGTIARIHSFEKNDLFLKLMEMGCVPGELIKVEQVAPLGDPISITVAGYNLSLRLDEAENIFMEEDAT